MAGDYAGWSPYNYVLGNPVILVDPDGQAPYDIIILGSASYQAEVTKQLNKLLTSSQTGYDLIQKALSSKSNLIIQAGQGGNEVYFGGRNDIGEKNIYLDLDINTFGKQNASTGGDFITGLGHELQHFVDISNPSYSGSLQIPFENDVDNSGEVYTRTFKATEINAVYAENEIRAVKGLSLRQTYAGINVFGMKLSTKSASYFEKGGLKSTDKYWDLVPIKGFNFSPNLIKPSTSALNSIWNSVTTTSVKTTNYSNSNTNTTLDRVGANGVKYSSRLRP